MTAPPYPSTPPGARRLNALRGGVIISQDMQKRWFPRSLTRDRRVRGECL